MSRVRVDIIANKSGLDAAVKSVHNSFNELKGMVAAAFTVEAVRELTVKTFEFAEEITNVAMKLDITVEQVQILRQAAKDNATEFGRLESILNKVSIAKDKALHGDANAKAFMAQLGATSQEQLKMRSVDLLFGPIADTVKTHSIESIALPLSKAFGKGFSDVIPLLKSDINEVGEKMKSMGAIMSTDTAVKLRVLGEQFKGLGTMLITIFAPALISVIQAIEAAISKYLHFAFDDKDAKKPEDPAKKTSWKNIWTNTKGVATGTMGALDVVGSGNGYLFPSLYEKGMERMTDAQMAFNETGWHGGAIDKLTDDMARSKSNPADAFDAMMEAQKKKVEELIKLLNKGDTGNPTDDKPKTTSRGIRIYSDELTRTGNMLGASFQGVGNVATALDVAKQQLAAAQKHNEHLGIIVDNTKQIAENTMPSSDGDDWEP